MFSSGKKAPARRATNYRRAAPKGHLLMVSARAGERGRDRRHKFAAVLLLLVACAGAGWAAVAGVGLLGESLFSSNDRFLIRDIDVRGAGRLPPAFLREQVGVKPGENLFAVDLERIRLNLESTPMIREAVVRRDLPDRLVVQVKERLPLARIAEGAGGRPMTVDRDGRVLGLARQQNLPLITGLSERGLGPGSDIREPAVQAALQVVSYCDANKVGAVIKLARIDVRQTGYLELLLEDGARVPFGKDRIEERLERLADVVRTAAALGRSIESADLTVDANVPVVYRAL